MIVTIDGPAGAGKSTVSRELAKRLEFPFLDTGAMYRAATLAALRTGLRWQDTPRLRAVATGGEIRLNGSQVLLNNEDVSCLIRTPEVTESIRYVADDPEIRAWMVHQQQAIGHELQDLVTEGRDQGTVAFPYAECKIYLNATPEERARRRVEEYDKSGADIQFEVVLDMITERDRRDSARAVGALRKADDAVEVVTDGMEIDEVVDRLEQLVRQRMPHVERE